MRKKIIAGNWKMNKTPKEALELIEMLKSKVDTDKADVVFCVPYIDLIPASDALKGTNISLGAQNMFYEENGAYTGEISPSMLKEVGVKYVITVSYTHLDVYKRQATLFLNHGICRDTIVRLLWLPEHLYKAHQ